MKARLTNSWHNYGTSVRVGDLLLAVKCKQPDQRLLVVWLANVPKRVSRKANGYWKIAERYQWSGAASVPTKGAVKLWAVALASKLPPLAWDLAMPIGDLLAKIKQIQDVLNSLE